jgi:hypothetical protein
LRDKISSLKQGHRINHENDLYKELAQLIDETFAKKQKENIVPLSDNSNLSCSQIEEDFIVCHQIK